VKTQIVRMMTRLGARSRTHLAMLVINGPEGT
jgi:DNA-binding NarL/FixJ family response regulator